MTVYSQHTSRGKVQVLATYKGPSGVVSSTVTSVENAVLAGPIVRALNRVSAYAAMPTDVWDEQARRLVRYPLDHLAALADRSARSDLLRGAHSLWYEHTMVLLHQALSDLDAAIAAVPAPVRTAVVTELDAEARGIRDGFAEYEDGVVPAPSEHRRIWEFDAPFVTTADADPRIQETDRDSLLELERGLTRAELDQSVADLRLLMQAFLSCANQEARMLVDGFEITDDPFDEEGERYFLTVHAPRPGGEAKRTWAIDLSRWVPDDPDDPDCSSATGEVVLDCVLTEPPSAAELVALLNHSNGSSAVLEGWARTGVGEVLDGTSFVVTKRYDD